MTIPKTCLYPFLLFSSLTLLTYGRHKIESIMIGDCPQGCTCENLNCYVGKSRLKCEEVGVTCENANVTQNITAIPKNVTMLLITGENMGHSSLDPFADFKKLRWLSLPDNGIRSLSVSRIFRRLFYLDLKKNRLCFPPKNYTLFKKLRKLQMEFNNLTYLEDIQFPRRLTHLILNHNNIQTPKPGSFKGLKELKVLQMQNNSIAEIEKLAYSRLQNLETLLLDFNQITELGEEAFKYLPNVSMVSLTHNRISNIHWRAFSLLGAKFHGVHQIHLEHNNLRLFERDYIEILLPLAKYYGIYLAGNPIFCDCKMMVIKEEAKRLLRDTDKTRCESPPQLRGTLLRDVDIDIKRCSGDYYYY